MPTSITYHQYLNPEKSMSSEAFKIHGLSNKFLSNKPLFSDIVDKFLDFIKDDSLIIHNAKFDIKFINAELIKTGNKSLLYDRVIDTLEIARKKYPGAKVSLDALCRRFSINNEKRALHGALLDSEILAKVYLELIGGKQPNLHLKNRELQKFNVLDIQRNNFQHSRVLATRITQDELDRHKMFIYNNVKNNKWYE